MCASSSSILSIIEKITSNAETALRLECASPKINMNSRVDDLFICRSLVKSIMDDYTHYIQEKENLNTKAEELKFSSEVTSFCNIYREFSGQIIYFFCEETL